MLTITRSVISWGRKRASGAVMLSVIALGAWFLWTQERNSTAPTRIWHPCEVEVAFWAWRNTTPAQDVVDNTVRDARMKTLFLRTGQLNYDARAREARRIRSVAGKFPRCVALHLVYNATRETLENFAQIDPENLAAAVAASFAQDVERARADGAEVDGLQLDLDVPTRLLPRYAVLLKALRSQLPPGVQLSITGLPTWMSAGGELAVVLHAVDFWIPQFYGARIPTRIEDETPIAAPELMRRQMAQARALQTPFYAGVAAYGYALLYDRKGSLINVRGDLDPAHIAADSNFELQSNNAADAKAAGLARRYLYRALADGGNDNLYVRAGESLVLEIPTAQSLRAQMSVVRAEAGERLRGVCLFRLPDPEDATNLTLAQTVAALDDAPPETRFDLELQSLADITAKDRSKLYLLTLKNNGTTNAAQSENAVMLDLPTAADARISSSGNFYRVAALCARGAEIYAPCAARRADITRLTARALPSDGTLKIVLAIEAKPTRQNFTLTDARLSIRTDDGKLYQQTFTLNTQSKQDGQP